MRNIYERITSKESKICVVGLGYVGLPIAVEFAKSVKVIGFDIDKSKVEKLKNGIDPTNDLGNDTISNTTIEFTNIKEDLNAAEFFIVTVPTPINQDKTPDLYPIESACELIAPFIKRDSYIVFESTVYPGVTEDFCVPILENGSQLKCGIDFKVGYSPERINPGDKVHTFSKITKIVSGIDEEALENISKIYEIVVSAGVHKASSIKVAEAAKVVENSQRDINIAFMNELALVFDKMGINTKEVIEAMNTKWNALGFYPGLVGGHCIGVDPYYFIYQAERLGYHSQIILSGRKINDSMSSYIGEKIIQMLVLSNKNVKSSRVAFLGITFKENTNDIRNSKVFDIIEHLHKYGIKPIVSDSYADHSDVKRIYGLDLVPLEGLVDIDCIVLSVFHDNYKGISKEYFRKISNKISTHNPMVIIDVKSKLNISDYDDENFLYWSL